jgi:hypothetical protein
MEHNKSQRRVGWQWTLVGAIVVTLGLAYAWRLHAQGSAAQPGMRGAGHLAPLPVSAADNQPRDMGGTFYFLESQARTLTARFADGTAIAERGLDGNIRTRSTDANGNDVGKLIVDQVSAREAEMLYEANGSQVFYAPIRSDIRPTLDWAALQAQALRRDGNPASVEWQGRFARARGARSGAIEDTAIEVVTEFNREITARTTLAAPKPGENKRSSTLTRLYDAGVEVGEVAWVPSQKLLMWSFKGLTKGVVSEETLQKSSSGGWTFQPSMAWANVQALAFYTFHGQLARNGMARAATTGESRGWVQRLTQAVLPVLDANAPGCDGLHWLDNTVFRPCCDSHDLCYVKAGCNQYSWFWPPSMSWSCTACNTVAAYCFYTTVGITTGTCVYMPGACQW